MNTDNLHPIFGGIFQSAAKTPNKKEDYMNAVLMELNELKSKYLIAQHNYTSAIELGEKDARDLHRRELDFYFDKFKEILNK